MDNARYFDVSAALVGGYCVVLVRGRRVDGQALFETANDVAAAAALASLAVLTSDETIIQACKALNVATALPPPQFDRKAWRCEEQIDDRATTQIPWCQVALGSLAAQTRAAPLPHRRRALLRIGRL
jgi:hypothetical protein